MEGWTLVYEKLIIKCLIWNYFIMDIDCGYVLLLYVDLLLNYRIGLLFLYKPVDQIRGHVRPMSACLLYTSPSPRDRG